mmetsp:Transcript_2976/g.5993  ORF Transcript_2976/g.5993 Transcript_2976/m.5993 type:complete len:269 (+) Transcript_2976:95-901(+)
MAASHILGSSWRRWTNSNRSFNTAAAAAAAGDPLKTVLVIGTTRTKNIGNRVASFLERELERRGHVVTVLDPKKEPFFMQLAEKHHFHYKPGEAVPEVLEKTARVIESADAYVVCSPEMNHTISPAVTNTMNYFSGSLYKHKVSGIATYSAGMWGGARCGVALRAYLSELGRLPVSATMQMRSAWMGKSWEPEEGQGGKEDEAGALAVAGGTAGQLDVDDGAVEEAVLAPAEKVVHKSADSMLNQLEFYALATRRQRREESRSGASSD